MFKNRLGQNRLLAGIVFALGSLIFGSVLPANAAEKRQREFSDERPSTEKRMCLQLSEIDNSVMEYPLQLPLEDIEEELSPWSDSLECQSEALQPEMAFLVDTFNEEFPLSAFPNFDACSEPRPLSCNFEVTQVEEFQCHEITYTGERRFACPYEGCNYRSSRVGDLRRHEIKHTGEKPFACPYEGCDYRSPWVGNLRRHQKRHTRDKPFTDPDAATFRPHQQASN